MTARPTSRWISRVRGQCRTRPRFTEPNILLPRYRHRAAHCGTDWRRSQHPQANGYRWIAQGDRSPTHPCGLPVMLKVDPDWRSSARSIVPLSRLSRKPLSLQPFQVFEHRPLLLLMFGQGCLLVGRAERFASFMCVLLVIHDLAFEISLRRRNAVTAMSRSPFDGLPALTNYRSDIVSQRKMRIKLDRRATR
jgi:hypothetical protein